MKVSLKRENDKVHFKALSSTGKSVLIDGSEKAGGEELGARPMELLLMGLGGCSGIDISLILGKMKQHAEDFEINVIGDRDAEQVPSLFQTIHAEFVFHGTNLTEKGVIKAADLSMEKYCSVAMILAKSASITYSVELNGSQIKDTRTE